MSGFTRLKHTVASRPQNLRPMMPPLGNAFGKRQSGTHTPSSPSRWSRWEDPQRQERTQTRATLRSRLQRHQAQREPQTRQQLARRAVARPSSPAQSPWRCLTPQMRKRGPQRSLQRLQHRSRPDDAPHQRRAPGSAALRTSQRGRGSAHGRCAIPFRR